MCVYATVHVYYAQCVWVCVNVYITFVHFK